MIEIVPNWHPIWVHFAIALLITAAGVYLLLGWKSGRVAGQPPAALIVARWLLWMGAAASLAALLTGYWASGSVAHDELGHANMLVHRNWALVATAWFLAAAVVEYLSRRRIRASAFTALLLAGGSISLLVTGLEGAENVYEHGLGVQRLPEVAAHQHEHDDHDEATTPEAPAQEHDHGEQKDDSGSSGSGAGHEHDHAASGRSTSLPPATIEAEHPVAQVATALNQAIRGGDSERIRSLMVEDVQIFESGNVESSLSEYASHHMESDMAFMGAMQSELISREMIDAGDMAMVLSRHRVHGSYKEENIDLVTTETLVLERRDGQWKIVHIHWSSG